MSKEDVDVVTEDVGVTQGRGHKPRKAGSLQKLEKARKGILLYSLQRNQSCQHLDFGQMKPIFDFWPPEL